MLAQVSRKSITDNYVFMTLKKPYSGPRSIHLHIRFGKAVHVYARLSVGQYKHMIHAWGLKRQSLESAKAIHSKLGGHRKNTALQEV